MKSKRQEKILQIIASENIETQEELINRLRLAGFDVTQATVSRDIRELKLTKVMTDMGVYKYTVPTKTQENPAHIYTGALSASIKSVENAGNLIVVKTYPGMANAVAAGIDSLSEPELLGCVAGDDTIIMVARTQDAAADIRGRLYAVITA
jgi:transcriptional regulator of arginine metabolism